MMLKRSTRRDFLKRTATAAGVAAAVPYFRSSDCAKAESKSDRLTVASIGVSTYKDRWRHKGVQDGRGAVIGHQAGELGDMVACCDVNRQWAERFASRYGGKCRIYGDYRKLLQRKDVQAVTIGTPDHWHSKIAVEAMQAGKDVYCEKPLTLTIDEGKKICKVAKATGRVFQVGTQQRTEYDRMFLKAVALARSGRLGKRLRAISSVGKADRGGPFKNQEPPAHLNWV
jgi:predicted dehydrogenase